MRALVLLLVFAIPPLVATSAAYAKAATDLGKPVCMHFDDNGNPATRTAVAAVVPTSAVNTKTVAAASAQPASTASINGTQSKGGGTSDAMRARNTPHWQTFLPGMFR